MSVQPELVDDDVVRATRSLRRPNERWPDMPKVEARVDPRRLEAERRAKTFDFHNDKGE